MDREKVIEAAKAYHASYKKEIYGDYNFSFDVADLMADFHIEQSAKQQAEIKRLREALTNSLGYREGK